MSESRNEEDTMRTISREELLDALNIAEPVLLLEALPEKYYAAGHLPGALHFPHDRVDALASHVIPDKAQPVVVYCASDTCKNSHLAAEALERLGYTHVRVYLGGKQEWQAAGLPLQR
jgi:rhodanese-related sulfurtransferase